MSVKNLGQLSIEDVFIRGTERKQGVNKTSGNEYDFSVVRFDDETGEAFEIRLEDNVTTDKFPRRKEGTLIVNVYGSNYRGLTTYLKAVDFKEYKDK